MSIPPGYASNLMGPATLGLGSSALPAGYASPPSAYQLPDPASPYGFGPEPIGSRVGTDDYPQMALGESLSENGINGDALEESQFRMPDAIDTEIIKKAKNKSWMDELSIELDSLIEDGKNARRSGRRDDWVLRWRRAYEGSDAKTGGPWSGSSRIVPPDMRAAIETTNARNMEALFASRERVRIKARFPESADAGNKLVKHIDDFFHSEEIDLRSRLTPACLQGMVDGTILCDTFWRREKAKRRSRVRITNEILQEFGQAPIANPQDFPVVRIGGRNYKYGTIATVEREVVVRNHFDFRFVSVLDFFMYPATATSIEDSTIAGYEFVQSENDIRVCAASGQYDEKAVDDLFRDDSPGPSPMASAVDPTQLNTEPQTIGADTGISPQNEANNKVYDRYKMRKFWARVRDVNNDKMFEDFLCVMEVSTKKILFLQADPYDNLKRSIREINFDPRIGGGFYSYSMVEKSLDAHLELQAVVRLGIDLAVLASSIIIPVDSTGRRNAQNITFKPGVQFWKTDEMGTMGNPIAFPLVQNQFIPQRSLISSYVEKITGAGEILTGATPESGTATAANIQVTSSGIRGKVMLLNILKFLTWLYNQYRDMTQQFMEETPGKSFAISLGPGRGFEDISLDEISIEGSITAYCDAIDPDVALKFQTAEKILTLLMQSPFAQSDLERQYQITADYADTLGYDFELAPRIGTKEQAKELQQKTAQEEAQKMQAQAGELKVPQLPPSMSSEFFAALLLENPDKVQNLLGLLKESAIAESAGKLRETTTKIAAEAITNPAPPQPPKPIGSQPTKPATQRSNRR